MDIGKSFSYPFEDNKWLSKLIIGALVSIVPILNFAWAGYLIDLLKNVINKAAEPLPEWTDFGGKFMKGLLIWVAGLIYALPVICLSTIFITTASITLSSLTEGDTVNTLGSAFSGVGILLACLAVLYGLLLSFFYPAMLIHFSRKETFGSLFEIGAIIKVATSNLSPYLTAWLIGIVAAVVVGLVVGLVSAVVGIIPCIGWLVAWVLSGLTTVYISVIWAHLFGQVASQEPSMAIVN
jgi:hypothetical protein